MTLALDPKKDILVPVPVLKKFAGNNKFGSYPELAQEIRVVLTEQGIPEEKLDKDAKYSFLKEGTEEYKRLEAKFKELDANISSFANTQQARLFACFLYPFEGKVTDQANIIWQALLTASDEYNLKNVEEEAKQYRQKRQQAFTNIANLNKKLQEDISNLAPLTEAFTKALNDAGFGSSLSESRNLQSVKKQYMLDKKLYENLLIDRSEYLASLVKTKNLILELKNAVVGAAPTIIVPSVRNINNQKRKVINRFKVTKKLYEHDLLTRSEYMAALLEVRNILMEVDPTTPAGTAPANAPAPAPAPANAPANAPAPAGTTPAIQEAIKGIKEFFQGIEYTLKPLGTLAVLLQDGLTRVRGSLNESKKEPLNEIVISLPFILAALAAVASWFAGRWSAKKFGGYFSGNHIQPSGYNQIKSPTEQEKIAATLLSGLNAGLGPTGQLIGDDGKEVAATYESIKSIETELTNSRANIEKITNKLVEAKTKITSVLLPTVTDPVKAAELKKASEDFFRSFETANFLGQVDEILKQIKGLESL